MKVLAYYPLHYGKEYLKESLLSIVNHVDEICILYTDRPSYGHGTSEVCPEAEEELRVIVKDVCGSKYSWVKRNYAHEGEHRSFIERISDNQDLILAVDADEVWGEIELDNCLKQAYDNKECKYFGINGYVNFWRSFNYACYDGFAPVRIINRNNTSRMQQVLNGKIYHFSCAQNLEIIRYKWEIHGHKNELRPDWFDKYNRFELQDVHPVSIGLWNATPFDKTTLPEILKRHPNYNKELI